MVLFWRPAVFALEEVDGTFLVEIVGVLSAPKHEEEHGPEGYGPEDAANGAAYDRSNVTVRFTGYLSAREHPT